MTSQAPAGDLSAVVILDEPSLGAILMVVILDKPSIGAIQNPF